MSKKKRILILAQHRLDRSPGQRFRFEQYLTFLHTNGFECDVSYLISKADDFYFYSKGHFLKKFLIFLRSIVIRLKDLIFISRYDLIFIFREAHFVGPPIFEFLIRLLRKRVIFDFDDAIWIPTESKASPALSWLKCPEKTSKIISWSDLTLAGNPFLFSYASLYSNSATIIPTTIDTELYVPIDSSKKNLNKHEKDRPLTIGWSGSFSTIDHFKTVISALIRIKEKYGNRVTFKVIGDVTYREPRLEITGIEWRMEDEIAELSSIDIGIMPLPNDEWSKGKCGLKGLQYMALAIPTIMSPVGVNKEIVCDGLNGFLADSEDEWVDKLSQLIDSTKLRASLGEEGRKTVIERYSVQSQRDRYLKAFQDLLSSDKD